MRKTTRTAGIALSVLLCLAVAGTVAQVVMGAGPYLLMFLLGLQEEWQINGAVAFTWLGALAPIIAVVCIIARAAALRGESVAGIMLGVAAYPALSAAFVVLTPESWEEVRWIGFGHGFVAVPVAIGVAVLWTLVRPSQTARGGASSAADGGAYAPLAQPTP